MKTCRYFLQAAAVGVTKPTSQQTLGGRPPPYGKLGKSLSSFSKRQTGGPSFLYNLTSTCNYFLILPKILHKKRRGKENRFPIENQWASFFTSFSTRETWNWNKQNSRHCKPKLWPHSLMVWNGNLLFFGGVLINSISVRGEVSSTRGERDLWQVFFFFFKQLLLLAGRVA